MADILIIDDDAQIRRAVIRILAGAGHVVHEAADGRKGLELFRAEHPQLVITDILMPTQDGIETILELRREAPSVSIIAISGDGDPKKMSYLDFASKLGADGILSKPFRAAELIQAVATLLCSKA
jgi:CheY-like chemotaxis protein